MVALQWAHFGAWASRRAKKGWPPGGGPGMGAPKIPFYTLWGPGGKGPLLLMGGALSQTILRAPLLKVARPPGKKDGRTGPVKGKIFRFPGLGWFGIPGPGPSTPKTPCFLGYVKRLGLKRPLKISPFGAPGNLWGGRWGGELDAHVLGDGKNSLCELGGPYLIIRLGTQKGPFP